MICYILVFSPQRTAFPEKGSNHGGFIREKIYSIFNKYSKPLPVFSDNFENVLSGFGLITDINNDEKTLLSIHSELKALEDYASHEGEKSLLKSFQKLILLDLNVVKALKSNAFTKTKALFVSMDNPSTLCAQNIESLAEISILFDDLGKFGEESLREYTKYPDIYGGIFENVRTLKKYAHYSNAFTDIYNSLSLLCKNYLDAKDAISLLDSEKIENLCSSGLIEEEALKIESKISRMTEELKTMKKALTELPTEILNAIGFEESKLKRLNISISLLLEFVGTLKSGMLCSD
ncbi:MAG: hypothetical protein J7L44_03525 [Candidatus Diapherotrites archaeon]|nr:hypothetical protein [Candidatus Diapherotrites archaeon]